MKSILLSILFLLSYYLMNATTLHIGNGFPYTNLEQVAPDAQPGDTILFHEGTHLGGQYIFELQGSVNAWIYIMNAPNETAVLEGGNNAIQFVDPAYLHVSGLIFQHQTGNGVNTDDGGDYSTPAHHVIFENCTFQDMSANGNNDLLKLSGLDFFEIRNCTFLNGADGGSGIDMVGCHNGVIEDNYFENMGTNCIQTKGGAQYIRIEGNFFRNGGNRTLNLGGSTGLQFFRPDTAHFEAADLQVYSNVIVGSWAAVAYVGSVNVEVVNNIIYRPENWVIRILQETVDPNRFYECGDNTFRNNIVYLGNNLSTETNIGSNTAPETFIFSNNLWCNFDNPNWVGPSIPVEDLNNILNQNPLFADPDNDDYNIPMNSPAAGSGVSVDEPKLDFFDRGFASPPSIGAIEANPHSNVNNLKLLESEEIIIFPNPTKGKFTIQLLNSNMGKIDIEIFDQIGRSIEHFEIENQDSILLGLDLIPGIYFLKVKKSNKIFTKKIIINN
ncbi:MAG: T9SS type A sorting domain-containing protein [Saprospiraceae bacterium]|nr:T9SS type A sorting domain-containing protein [Saprospiraceae bacterium]